MVRMSSADSTGELKQLGSNFVFLKLRFGRFPPKKFV